MKKHETSVKEREAELVRKLMYRKESDKTRKWITLQHLLQLVPKEVRSEFTLPGHSLSSFIRI